MDKKENISKIDDKSTEDIIEKTLNPEADVKENKTPIVLLDDEQLKKDIEKEDDTDIFVENDIRFRFKKDDGKFEKKLHRQQEKSIRKDNRKARFVSLRNNLKLEEGTGLFSFLSAIGSYLDYIFNIFTIGIIVISGYFAITSIIEGNWEVTLVSVLVSIAFTFINDRIGR